MAFFVICFVIISHKRFGMLSIGCHAGDNFAGEAGEAGELENGGTEGTAGDNDVGLVGIGALEELLTSGEVMFVLQEEEETGVGDALRAGGVVEEAARGGSRDRGRSIRNGGRGGAVFQRDGVGQDAFVGSVLVCNEGEAAEEGGAVFNGF